MYYHLYRNVFYHQLLSAIQTEINEEELPRSVWDSAAITEQTSTQTGHPQKFHNTSTDAKDLPR